MIIGASAANGSNESEPAADNSSRQSSDTGKKGEAPSKEQAEPAQEPEPAMTAGQENSLGSAED